MLNCLTSFYLSTRGKSSSFCSEKTRGAIVFEKKETPLHGKNDNTVSVETIRNNKVMDSYVMICYIKLSTINFSTLYETVQT